jgi:hypothetical protein
MKTNVQKTSIDAYHNLNLSNQEREVMRAFAELDESCVADVAQFLGWEKSTVAGRINMLKTPINEKGKGRLECSGKKNSKATGIRSLFYTERK